VAVCCAAAASQAAAAADDLQRRRTRSASASAPTANCSTAAPTSACSAPRDGYDPIAPGTPRDSWGIIRETGSAWADQASLRRETTVSTIVAGASTATYDTHDPSVFDVFQSYSFVGGGNILRIDTHVTTTQRRHAERLFQRDVDWDIDPTPSARSDLGPHGADRRGRQHYYGFEIRPGHGAYLFSCSGGCLADRATWAAASRSTWARWRRGRRSFSYYYGHQLRRRQRRRP
jgi:hypothetical protein